VSVAGGLASFASRGPEAAGARAVTRVMWIALAWITLAALPGQGLAADPPALVQPVLLANAPAEARAPSPGAMSSTRRNLWFGAATIAGLALSVPIDENVKDRFPEFSDRGKPVADFVRPLGSTNVIGVTLVAGWAAGKVFHSPTLERASVRSGIAIIAAGTVAEGLKIAIGRARPNDEPEHPYRFKPFSGNNSFPSGHATIAFAAATAISRETDARWAPWITYPTAAVVCWSRLRDNKHWLSDVVAGAAVGYWITDRTEDFIRARWGDSVPFGMTVTPGADGPMVGMSVEF
jgi:membrane-associated phospholipid phosphatase